MQQITSEQQNSTGTSGRAQGESIVANPVAVNTHSVPGESTVAIPGLQEVTSVGSSIVEDVAHDTERGSIAGAREGINSKDKAIDA